MDLELVKAYQQYLDEHDNEDIKIEHYNVCLAFGRDITASEPLRIKYEMVNAELNRRKLKEIPISLSELDDDWDADDDW